MSYALTPSYETLELEHESVTVIDRPPPEPAAKVKRRARRRAKPVRLQDIAKAADVSIATVSMVVNRNPRISPATAKRVQRFLNQMGYRPSGSAARMSKASRSQPTLAVLLPAQRHAFEEGYVSALMSGITEAAARLGHAVLLQHATPDFLRARQHVDLLEQKEADGMLCIGFNDGHALVEDFSDDPSRAMVLVDTHLPRSGVDSVACDYRSGAEQAMNYLLQLGHRRIGLITSTAQGRSMQDITEIYRNLLTDHGVTGGEAWIVDGRCTEAGGDEAAERLLLKIPNLTAIFAASDRMAIGALCATRRLGIKVPDGLSVVGFDNLPQAAFMDPPLTTVQVPLHEVGAAACERLIERISGRTETVCERLGTHLVVRGSSARPRDLPVDSFAA